MFRGALILCVVLSFVYAENYTWGIRQHNDRLLDRTFAKRSSSFARVVTLDISYPNKTMNGTRLPTINQIVVLDQKPKGEGGYATLTRGGVGFNVTSLHLKSRRNKGIDFIVDIYGV